jgi:arylamine N-acetyltransferase
MRVDGRVDGPRRPGDRAVVDAYLRRLGVDAEPPSADALARLHRAHVERVPYETVWIHLAEGWGIDAAESMARIAAGGRGGYCYQLNGALAGLLEALGYRVTRHVAGVHDRSGPDPASLGNHVALVVHDLPTAANPSGRWYADAGLGDGPHDPLPLVAGDHAQGPMRYTLAEVTDVGRWHFDNDPGGSPGGVSIVDGPVGLDAFAARHRHNATSPASPFAATVTAQRRHDAGADVLRGCVLTRRRRTTTVTTIERRGDWLAALDDVFGLRPAVPPTTLDALWGRVHAAHEAWIAAGAPGGPPVAARPDGSPA